MRLASKRVLVTATTVTAVLAAVPALVWVSLTHQPGFYRAMVGVPHEQREARAKRLIDVREKEIRPVMRSMSLSAQRVRNELQNELGQGSHLSAADFS